MNLAGRILVTILLTLAVATAGARSHYSMVHNRFAALAWNGIGSIEGDLLVVENPTADDILLTDTTAVKQAAYTLTAVFANRHNRAGRRYRAGDKQVVNTRWGLVFDVAGHTWTEVVLACHNTALLDDITDRRTMTVSVVHHADSTIDTLATKVLSQHVDLAAGMNALRVEVENRHATISIGKKQLQPVLELTLPERGRGSVKGGVLIGGGAEVAIERVVMSIPDNQKVFLPTKWTRESLAGHFAQSNDPVEGFWTYQDRDMSNQWLRLGGRYTLAVVANGRDYDLIYISGAQVNPSDWHVGMLKGRITKTIFGDHYDLFWIDATGMPIAHDAYATVDNGVLLTLRFPVYNSQIRLSKQISAE